MSWHEMAIAIILLLWDKDLGKVQLNLVMSPCFMIFSLLIADPVLL